MVERRRPQRAERFLDDLGRLVLVLEPGDRRFEIARIGEAVGADRPKLGQAQRQARGSPRHSRALRRRLRPGTSRRAGRRRSIPGATSIRPISVAMSQRARLRDDQQLAVGVDEDAPLHRPAGAVKMDRDAFEIGRLAVGEHRHHAVDEVRAVRQVGRRVPAQAVGRERLIDRCPARTRARLRSGERPVIGRRPHPVQPGAAVLVPRRGEGSCPTAARHRGRRRAAAASCGPCGSAPATASVSKWPPKPVM